MGCKKGVTLVELMVVVFSIAIFGAISVSVLRQNGLFFGHGISRANFFHQGARATRQIVEDARNSRTMDIVSNRTVTLFDPDDLEIATYRINRDGDLELEKNKVTKIIAQNLDFDRSSFSQKDNALVVDIVFQDTNFGKEIDYKGTTTKVHLRNAQ